MILNPESIIKKKKFNKKISFWLMYEQHIPLLSIDSNGKDYWFADSDCLLEALKKMPLLMRVINNYW